MRMKMVCDDRTLREISNEFLALKKAQKIRDRTLSDYRKYIDKFLAQSENSLDVEILKAEILDFIKELLGKGFDAFGHIKSLILGQSFHHGFVQSGHWGLLIGTIIFHNLSFSIVYNH